MYDGISVVHVELYTDEKSPPAERTPEAVFERHGICCDKAEVWIEREKPCEVLYSTVLTGL